MELLVYNCAGGLSFGRATSSRRTDPTLQHASGTPTSAGTPAFNESLTKERLQPHILTALMGFRPESRSALELTHVLWPMDNALRPAMRTMVGPIHKHTLTLLCNNMHAGLIRMLLSARDLHLLSTDVYAYHCMANLFMYLTLATCFVRALGCCCNYLQCMLFLSQEVFMQHNAVLPDDYVVFCIVRDVNALALTWY